MNFTILIFLCLFAFLGLWLSAKYLGKFGLGVFSIVSYTLSLLLGGITVTALSAAVSVGTVFFISGAFALYLLIKKYGLKEGAKILIVITGVIVLYYMFIFLVELYLGALFFATLWNMISGILVEALALLVGFGLIYWLFTIKKLFKSLNEEFKEFLIMLIGLFAFAFISVFIGQIGEVSFVSMLLNWLVTYLVYVVLVAVFFVCDRFIVIEENVTFGDNVNEKITKTIEKTKNVIIKKNKTNKEDEEENLNKQEEDDEEDEGFELDDDDEFNFDFDENYDILPNKNKEIIKENVVDEDETTKEKTGVVIRQRPRPIPERLKKENTNNENEE